jgi:hypothetical protein
MLQRVVIALAVLAAVALLVLILAILVGGSDGTADVPPVQLQPEPAGAGEAR